MTVTTLLLLRHATAESARPGHHDRDRRLTAHGEQEARGVGDFLRSSGLVVDRVLCSPAVRTRQTLAGLALGEGPGGPDVDHPSPLYLAGVPELLELVALAEGTTVLVVAHSPAVPGAVHELADPATSAAAAYDVVDHRFPPATLARLTLTAGSVGPGSAALASVRLAAEAGGHVFE